MSDTLLTSKGEGVQIMTPAIELAIVAELAQLDISTEQIVLGAGDLQEVVDSLTHGPAEVYQYTSKGVRILASRYASDIQDDFYIGIVMASDKQIKLSFLSKPEDNGSSGYALFHFLKNKYQTGHTLEKNPENESPHKVASQLVAAIRSNA